MSSLLGFFWGSLAPNPQGCCDPSCSLPPPWARQEREALVNPAPFIRKGVRAAPTGVAQPSPPSLSVHPPTAHCCSVCQGAASVARAAGPRTTLLLAQLPDRFYCTLEKKLCSFAGHSQGLANYHHAHQLGPERGQEPSYVRPDSYSSQARLVTGLSKTRTALWLVTLEGSLHLLPAVRQDPTLGSGRHINMCSSPGSHSQPCAPCGCSVVSRGLGYSAWSPGGVLGGESADPWGWLQLITDVRNKRTGGTEVEDGDNRVLSSFCPVLTAGIYLQCHSVSRGAS